MSQAAISTNDRPFALPNRELITTVVDLPFPVSTNRLWRYGKGRAYVSAQYRAWICAADSFAMEQRVTRNRCIETPFRAELLLQDGRRADADNCVKCCLDAAKRWNLIADDRYCRKIEIEFVASHIVRHGARLTLIELA